MKKLNLVLGLVALLFAGSLKAQDAQNPWGISIGAHAVDHTSVSGLFDGFFDYDDYSVVPPLSKLSVVRHLFGPFSADLTASIGQIDNKRLKLDDLFFLNAGLGLRFQFLNAFTKKSSWFDPYLRVGASYNKTDYRKINISKSSPYKTFDGSLINKEFKGAEDHFMTQLGAGINFWFTDNIGLNIASDYNLAPTVEGNTINFFQHTAGLAFKFGLQDRDKDGIPDDKDECPDTFGLKEFNGCPDTDGDGIRDIDDACPEVAGLPEYNGCPDTDGDGIADNVDKCPNQAGPKENNGCPWPDTDGDGLNDNVDKCPNQAGPKENNGCPWPDTDGDGFTDNVDKCPNEPGIAPSGCPEAAVMVQNINVGFAVEFDFDKASIRPVSKAKIEEKAAQIRKVLEVYPDMTLYIDGHTDSKGAASYNKNLSQKRAASVVQALEGEGISAGVLTPRGFGESQPKCSNDTEEGRQCNRRVEVTINKLGEQK
ncbi:Outer membrane porin F precursor [Candidatus Ornithobacterium hominis]|uniref:Outer membrane porin F n=1 Tax=Candidatus Ornithobacterium hominis TaxID=2497989 RepID=A0A383TTV5_9FLAO|nr:OmpA family protein [Candidatus Ornithobacterium hominis]SZD71084.1 Outer membrane porin F precursor [Candidatus Ornithobacterium hominis]